MNKYYTQLTNDKPDLIRVEVELTAEQIARARKNTDSKASDSINQVVKRLIQMNTSRSISKLIK